jgi:hypothetical protein
MKLVGDIIFLIIVYGLLHAAVGFFRNQTAKAIRRALHRAVALFRRKAVDADSSPPLENPYLR